MTSSPLAEARQHLARGDLAAASRLAGTLLDHNPTDGAVLALLAEISLAVDQPSRALSFVAEARRHHSPTVTLHRLAAAAHVALGDLAAARTALEAALALDGQNEETLNSLGRLHLRQDRFEAAAACFRALLDHHPRAGEGWVNLAGALTALARHDEARTAAETAVTLWPDEPVGHLHLGAAALGQGDGPAAVSALQTCCRLAPDWPVAWETLGEALMAVAAWGPATDALAHALALDPDRHAARLALGRAYAHWGDPVAALACADGVLAAVGPHPEATALKNDDRGQ